MWRLREAIINLAREDVDLIGEPTQTTEELVDAWNAVCDESPTVGIPESITEEDWS